MYATIKKESTNEPNISKRTITYDLYVDGKYTMTYGDVLTAIAERARLNIAHENTIKHRTARNENNRARRYSKRRSNDMADRARAHISEGY
jgi:hypothetical protein